MCQIALYGNYKGRGTVLVVTEKTGSTPNNTNGQIGDTRQLLFSGSGRFASRADAACDIWRIRPNSVSERLVLQELMTTPSVVSTCRDFVKHALFTQQLCIRDECFTEACEPQYSVAASSHPPNSSR